MKAGDHQFNGPAAFARTCATLPLARVARYLHAALLRGEGCVETCLEGVLLCQSGSCVAGNHTTEIVPKLSTSQGFSLWPQQKVCGSKPEVKLAFTQCGAFKSPCGGTHFKWPQAMLIQEGCILHGLILALLTCPCSQSALDFPLALPEVSS